MYLVFVLSTSILCLIKVYNVMGKVIKGLLEACAPQVQGALGSSLDALEPWKQATLKNYPQ